MSNIFFSFHQKNCYAYPFSWDESLLTDYLVALTLGTADHTDIWSISLATRLPIIPVPLEPTDPSVLLDLQQALNSIFEEADYGLSIDYQETPPPPKLNPTQQEWINSLNLTQK